ncbi:uncharacterized protein LOC120446178 isoform X1 [Drosophila santomea]|uniref:uncharacterized protein LOC120446178 isoform X1 n=1 Tax=Drosophila santomea TaxID=129105 RepID=UPI0019535572|nr:uncharacterized protein LOC120446178 isoform X1 [Drosophila santomea]
MAQNDITSYLNLERLNKTQKLISLYRSNECLWNPESPGFHSGSVKDDAWRRITRQMNCGLTPDQVKLQVLGLRNYYSKELAAIRLSQLKGYSYTPRHSYFEDLHFLGNVEEKANSTIKDGNLPPNFSEDTFISPVAFLSPCCSKTKCGYTFYKMILEPEPTNEEYLDGHRERSTSGNDRWYPTAYCVRCKPEEDENPCEACELKGQRSRPYSGSRSSLEGGETGFTKPRMSNQYQDQDPLKQFQIRDRSQYGSEAPCSCYSKDSPEKRSTQTQQNGVYVDMGNWDGDGSVGNGIRSDKWPGPRLCSQKRGEWKPRMRKVMADDNRKPACCSWKRNNNAICRRLLDQLAKQKNQSDSYSDDGESVRNRNCDCTQNRRQSGEDQLNVMLLQKKYRDRSSQGSANNPPNDRYSNTQPMSDQAYCNTSHPVQNCCYCTHNPGNQDVQRCNINGCQCVHCNHTVFPTHGNYYQPQLVDHNPANYSRSSPPGAPCEESVYLNDYGRCMYPEQQHVYCINAENMPTDVWVQAQSSDGPIKPSQMPMVPLSKSWHQETAETGPLQAAKNGSGRALPPQDLEKKYSSNGKAIDKPEQSGQNLTLKEQIESIPEDYDQGERNNVGSSQKKKRSYDSGNDSIGSRGNSNYDQRIQNDQQRIFRDTDNERRSRREQNKYICEDDSCPFNKRRQNEERPSERRSRNEDRDVNNPKSNYEDSPPSRRRKNNSDESNNQKVFQLQTDDSQLIACPAYDRRNPKECPHLKCPSPRHREDGIGRRSRNRDYEENNKPPTSKEKSQSRRSSPLENTYYEEEQQGPRERSNSHGSRHFRSKRKSNEETKRSKRRSEEPCNDETCLFGSFSSRQNKYRPERRSRNSGERENRSQDKGMNPRSNRRDNGYPCNDDTCPYADSLDLNMAIRERSRNRRDQSYSKENGEEENNERRYRSESSSRRRSLENNDYVDSARSYKRESDRYRKPRRKAPAEIDDPDYDFNEHGPRKYRNRYSDNQPEYRSPAEKSNKYSRMEDRNLPPKYAERPQKDYRIENRYRNNDNTVEDCYCDDFEFDEYDANNAFDAYPRRQNGSRNRKVPTEYNRAESSRRSYRDMKYDNSESEDMSYSKSDGKSTNRNRNTSNIPPRKSPPYSREADQRDSEDDCFCSDEETLHAIPNMSSGTNKNDHETTGFTKNGKQDKSRGAENIESRKNETRHSNSAPESPPSNRDMQEMKNPDDYGKEIRNKRHDVVFCECEPEKGEYSKNDNRDINHRGNVNTVSDEDCICNEPSDPNEPKLTVPEKRNQAGSICINLSTSVEDKNQKKESFGNGNKSAEPSVPKPLDAANRLRERKEPKAKQLSSSENQSPSVKKNLRPKTGISPRVQSRSTSPVRQTGALRTQPGEPVKIRATTRNPSQNAAKRTMETHAAANSKLPFDLNSAAYFICKLQDEGNNHQYLLVVPKKTIGPSDGHRMAPGQESVKQLHCPRQCSGFQSMSWDDSTTATQSQSPPQSQASGGLSILGSFRVPPVLASTALGIINQHLHRNTVVSHEPDIREAVYPPKRMRRILLTRPMSRPRRPVLRPSHKANAPILNENRTLLLTNNSYRNLSFGDHDREVIVLHPPDPAFRPSKNSFSKDEVEVQHITVPNEDTDVRPMPPAPPTKPKRTSVINP